jgi:hypothetical protein
MGVVEVQLLPGQTYRLWLDDAGVLIPSFRLEPTKPGDKAWPKVLKREKTNLWVTRAPAAAEHEKLRQSEIELIIHDFVSGEKKDRLRHLGPDDHP